MDMGKGQTIFQRRRCERDSSSNSMNNNNSNTITNLPKSLSAFVVENNLISFLFELGGAGGGGTTATVFRGVRTRRIVPSIKRNN